MLEILSLKPKVFALDISDLSLKIVELSGKGPLKELISFGSYEVPSGVISQGEIMKEDELALALKEAVQHTQKKSFHTPYAVVSLPEEKAFLQVIQLPLLQEKELAEAIRFEAENYIPFPIDSVYLDYQIVQPLSDSLDHLDVLLVALQKTTIDSYLSALTKAKIKPLALETESLSVSRALVPQETAPFPVLLLDIGATRTGFVVFTGKSPRFTVSIPFSSSQVTSVLAEALHIDRKTAEDLKIRYGLLPFQDQARQGAQDALESAVKGFAKQVKQYIDYYISHATHEHLAKPEHQIAHVYLCGRGALLKGLPEFLAKELKIGVSMGNPWVNILPDGTTYIPPISFEESLGYTTALGLALRAIQ